MMMKCDMEMDKPPLSSPIIKRQSCSSSNNMATLLSGIVKEEEPNNKRRKTLAAKPDITTTTTNAVPSPEQRSSSRWSDLPQDIIGNILEKLTLLADYDRFGAVCTSWRRASLDTLNRNHRIESKIHHGVPLLLLPRDRLVSEDDKLYYGRFKTDSNPWKRTLFDVFRQNTITDDFNLPTMPKSEGRCCGSSHGWLIFADRYKNIQLVNPFYIGGGHGGIVRLPSVYDEDNDYIDDFLERDVSCLFRPEFLVEKVILSADPALFPDDYVVVVLGNLMISFIRPGKDKDWTLMGTNNGKKKIITIEDIMFNNKNNTIYAVEEKGELYTCKITDPKPKLRRLATPPVLPSGRKQFYLMELSQGDILVVCRFLRCKFFRVFKLLTLGGRLTAWREVKNLGCNNALFLGENRSVCVDISATSHDSVGFQQNSIYFTDDRNVYFGTEDPFAPCTDMGIFNMEDQTVTRYYDHDQLLELVCIPPPIWFLPSLPGNWK